MAKISVVNIKQNSFSKVAGVDVALGKVERQPTRQPVDDQEKKQAAIEKVLLLRTGTDIS